MRDKKVPVIIQMEELECGAAALGMVLAHYGRWLSLEQLRRDCGVSRDGANAFDIIQAAKKYGLSAKGFRYSAQTILEKTPPLPCIAFWEDCHFLVITSVGPRYVSFNDPAQGRVRVTREQFAAHYSNVCLTFQKTPAFTTAGHPVAIRSFVRNRLKGSSAALAFVGLAGLITALVGVAIPLLEQLFVDDVLPAKDGNWNTYFFAMLFLFSGIQIAVTAANSAGLLRIRGKFEMSANTHYMWHVLHLPMSFFSQRPAGDIAGRQSLNEGIAVTLIQQLAPAALNTVMLIFYLVIMVHYSPVLTLIGVAAIAVNTLMARIISAKRVDITRSQARDEARLSSQTVAALGMIETIKASAAERAFLGRWLSTQNRINEAKNHYLVINQGLGALPGLIQQATNLLILVLGVSLIIQGEFTIGSFVAFQGFLSALFSPVNSLIAMGQSLQEMRTSMERVEDVMHYPEDREEPLYSESEAGGERLTGAIELKSVSFGYTPTKPPFITDFSLSIQPGQRIALVGASGSGKSTVAKLIAGLYTVNSGVITFDGLPLEAIPRERFTASVGMVDQNIVLFEDTVAGNIRMWREDIPDARVVAAARKAGIHDEILRREGGYSAMVEEGGKNFSGGQRQRLEIARTLAQDASILILDEATASLDALSEARIIDAIRSSGTTCVLVAHRLSTIRDCDLILVMDGGHVVQRGTHEKLMAAGGLYRELVDDE